MKMTSVCWIFAGLLFICLYLETSSSRCFKNQFKCSLSGKCIPLHWRCDGEYQCGEDDKTDEDDCTSGWKGRCPRDGYRCYNSRCLPGQWACDGVRHCADGEDEKYCRRRSPDNCLWNEIACSIGNCIPRYFRCDNKSDCYTTSYEERGCEDTKCPGEHRCGSGNCLSPSLVCDGLTQCNDNSDERDCDKCEKWGCAHDCNETSDGPECYCRQGYELDPEDGRTCNAYCLRNQFRCADGKRCIMAAFVCDDFIHCDDASDEDYRMCADRQCPMGEQLKCDGGMCHPDEFRCDGKRDCYDRSDERGCPAPPDGSCMENQFQCTNGSCFPKDHRCIIGLPRRCLSRSDELACNKSRCNEAYERPCDNDANACVRKSKWCDGHVSCSDKSDEKDCYTCENWGCSQICTETSNWPRCHCRLGFELDNRDQRTCTPIFFADISIDNSTGPAYILKGGKFILTCRFTGGDMHLWIKDGIIIGSTNIIHKVYLEGYSTAYSKKDSDLVTTMRLIVEHADSDHTGEYKCSTDALYSQNVTVVTDPSILNETDSNTEF